MADKQTPLKWVKSPNGVPEVYTNTSNITWSLDDIRIRLGQLIDSPNSGVGEAFRPAIEERAAVTFSWRNAKILRDQLTKLIDAYEAVNGPIQVEIKLVEPPI